VARERPRSTRDCVDYDRDTRSTVGATTVYAAACNNPGIYNRTYSIVRTAATYATVYSNPRICSRTTTRNDPNTFACTATSSEPGV